MILSYYKFLVILNFGSTFHKNKKNEILLFKKHNCNNNKETMTSIAKHSEMIKSLAINRLPIPIEIAIIIKDYLYHSEQTSPTIKKMIQTKNEIINLITNHSTVKMNEEIEVGQIIEEEDWWFRISIPQTHIYSQLRNIGAVTDDHDDYWPLSIEYEFCAKNCKACGEYKTTVWYCYEVTKGLSSQNMCKCISAK